MAWDGSPVVNDGRVERSAPGWWPTGGEEPDPRWSLANERTLLAYQRTALGLVVAGFAVTGSHSVANAPAWLAATGLPLIVLGAAVGLVGRRRFLIAQAAMREGRPLGAPSTAMFLPWGIALVGVLGLVLGIIQLFVAD